MLIRYAGWLGLAVAAGLVLVTLLKGSFRLFGFLMDVLLILIVTGGLSYVWVLRKRPGRGPAAENEGDLLNAAREELERREISNEEFARLKRNLKD